MPLDSSSPLYLHVLQNLSLIVLSLFFVPLCTLITLGSQLASPFTAPSKHIQHNRKWRTSSSTAFRPRVILVTGVGMSKGLAIARAFYREGHTVIGADFEPFGVPVSGRFSRSLKRFYRLAKPTTALDGSNSYVEGLLHVINTHNVELWVSCSGVASAMDDAKAAEAVEMHSGCKAIQFGATVTETLHEKHTFIQQAKKFGLNVPETHVITSVDAGMARLHGEKVQHGMKFIMKSIGLDDTIRADMTLLPRNSPEKTKLFLNKLRPSGSRPFVLQQFINGPEYCTHAIVIRGRVAAFTACPSAELLMHYKALDPLSNLSVAMQKYTEVYAKRLGDVTGHFSIDFMLDQDKMEPDLSKGLYPIECNPRAHTAVLLFEHDSKRMVEAYLRVLEGDEESKNGSLSIVLPLNNTGYYWVGHDIVTRGLVPLFPAWRSKEAFLDMTTKWKELALHVTSWKDGTYEIWDPWPFWWLYCVYWPGMFLSAMVTKSWWSRANVSTTKMFRC